MHLDELRSWKHPSLLLRHTLRSIRGAVQGKPSLLVNLDLEFSINDLMGGKEIVKIRIIPKLSCF